ncbi:MAG: MGMT family protein [Micrococcales bacterium]|nr:MGMT family protein [Micrococcales bacterium]MCL2667659.1 MGMT family protein [Micrococcales bacterium]
MARKSYNEKLQGPPTLPKVTTIDPDQAARHGGPRMLVAAPLQYDAIMSQIPEGQVTTVDRIRTHLAAAADADFTCPLTAGIFVNIVAHASEERPDRPVPWWRTLKTNGELNPKYPGGLESHKAHLEAEGHTVRQSGTRYTLDNLDDCLYALDNVAPTPP